MNLFSMVFTGIAIMQNPSPAHAQAVQSAAVESVADQTVTASASATPVSQAAPATEQTAQTSADGANSPPAVAETEQSMKPWSGH